MLSKSLFVGVATIATASASAIAFDHPLIRAILERADTDLTPGSPLYQCHAYCGNGILASQNAGYCTNSDFLGDYAFCLACAGPDNEAIWQYYGKSLAAAAASCPGLSITPSSGSDYLSSPVDASAAAAAVSGGTVATSSAALSVAASSSQAAAPTSSVPSSAAPSSVVSSSSKATYATSSKVSSASAATSKASSAAAVSITTKASGAASQTGKTSTTTTATSTIAVFTGAADRTVPGVFGVAMFGAVYAMFA